MVATVDFESLTRPVSAEAPCGADLELSGDIEYMSFIAGAESLLPKSYFGKDQAGNEGRPFDRAQINFEAQFDAAKPFLEKTRDLRLIGILAKLCILNRDFSGFIACIRAMAALLAAHWDDIHPRGEDGEFGLRAVTIESLDAMPTVVLPLQFLPLIEHSRLGNFSYRAYSIANGEIKPTEGEPKVDPAAIDRILTEVGLEELVGERQKIVELESALKQIGQTWREKCPSAPGVTFERLATTAAQIFTVLNTAIAKRDPSAALGAATSASAAGNGKEADTAKPAGEPAAVRITSTQHAGRALAATAAYFSRCEPSNPCLMMVRQAQDLLGKSFLEVLKVLIPDQVAKAAVNIGKEQFFSLPIERLAATATKAPAGAVNEPDPGAPIEPDFEVSTRTEALALLEEVGNYFRISEPSSPIPFLTERARDLAQRDFLSVLRALLPANTLKSGE
jgi:type VI secretion system protein ImpA